jgi:tRNA(fMet)-specific endonuclease VapC
LSFLLDTNICSAHLRGRPGLTHKFIQHGGRLYLSTIVLGELYTWAYRRADPAPLIAGIEALSAEMIVLAFDADCAKIFGQIRARHFDEGTPVFGSDVMIASLALRHDLTVVTHNVKDFKNIDNLRIEDWLA